MPHSNLSRIAAAVAFVIFLCWGLGRLFALGGAPEERGTSVHYRLKPVMRVLLAIGALGGLGFLWEGTNDLKNHQIGLGLILIGIGIFALASVVLSQSEITLDELGIHYRSPTIGNTFIPWNDLSHFEQLYNGRALTTNYFIRSKTGVTIAAGDSSFDTTDLLRRIQAHHTLPEKPYKRRKWYGG